MSDFNCAQLNIELSELRREFEALKGDVADLLEGGTIDRRRFWWPSMKKSEASRLWCDLIAWAEELKEIGYVRTSKVVDATLPNCWFIHKKTLDRMTAIYANWIGSYSQNSPLYSPITFQRHAEDDFYWALEPTHRCQSLRYCLADPKKREPPPDQEQVLRELLETLPH